MDVGGRVAGRVTLDEAIDNGLGRRDVVGRLARVEDHVGGRGGGRDDVGAVVVAQDKVDVLGVRVGLGDLVGFGLAAHKQGVIVVGVCLVKDVKGVAADVTCVC